MHQDQGQAPVVSLCQDIELQQGPGCWQPSPAEVLLSSLQLPSWQLRACLTSMQGSLLSPSSSLDMGAEPLSPTALTFLQNLGTAQPAMAEVSDFADA